MMVQSTWEWEFCWLPLLFVVNTDIHCIVTARCDLMVNWWIDCYSTLTA